MYEIIFYAGTVLACLFLIISIVLFVKNGVWKLIGDVTGLNAKRAIRKLDKKGAEDTSKTEAINQEVSKVLVHRATTTGSLQAVTESVKKEKPRRVDRKKIRKRRIKEEKTTLLQDEEQKENNNSIFEVEDEIIVLAGEEKTRVVNPEAVTGEYTTLLAQEDSVYAIDEDEITTKLYAEDAATDLLSLDDVTDVLSTEEDQQTTLLMPEGGDGQTALLMSEGDDSRTTLLMSEGDDSRTTLLTSEGDDNQTTLLTLEGDDGQTTLPAPTPEAEITPFEPMLQEDEELMSLLQNAVAKNEDRE